MSRLWEWIKGIKRCPHCDKVCKNSCRYSPICTDCFHPIEWFYPDWPKHRINVFDIAIQTTVTKEVPLSPGQYIKRLQLERDQAVKDLAASDRKLVEANANVDGRLHAIEETWREQNRKLNIQLDEKRVQRDGDLKLIASLEKAISENNESIRLRDNSIDAKQAVILLREKEIRDKERFLADKEAILVAQEQKLKDAQICDQIRLTKIDELRKDLEQAQDDRDLASSNLKMVQNKLQGYENDATKHQKKLSEECHYSAQLANLIGEAARVVERKRQETLKARCPQPGTGLTVEVDGKQITNLLGLAIAGGKMSDSPKPKE